MDLSRYLTGRTVELPEVLDARERRAAIQQELLARYPMPLVSFTLNIAGPMKVFPLAVQTYEEGLDLIRCRCRAYGIPLRHTREVREDTGYECFLSVDSPAEKVKQVLSELEQASSLGRLFDIDVLGADGVKLSRTDFGQPERTCLVCGKPAFVCSRARAHSLKEILSQTCAIMRDYFTERHAARLSSCAARALLYEVLTTPKPGLVDRHNTGAHDDMDIVTFETSALALLPYFKAFVTYGAGHAAAAPETYLADLRPMGLQAEIAMLRATGGVNTHKGIIFSLGFLLTALGVFYEQGRVPDRQALQTLCRRMAAPLAEDFRRMDGVSHGEALYAAHGVRGARGEAMDGFPALFGAALPTLDRLIAEGADLNDAGVVTLLHILAATEDTNLMARSSPQRAAELRSQITALLAADHSTPELLAAAEDLNRQFIAEHLSPGGSADLLALAYFVRFLEQEGLMQEC